MQAKVPHGHFWGLSQSTQVPLLRRCESHMRRLIEHRQCKWPTYDCCQGTSAPDMPRGSLISCLASCSLPAIIANLPQRFETRVRAFTPRSQEKVDTRHLDPDSAGHDEGAGRFNHWMSQVGFVECLNASHLDVTLLEAKHSLLSAGLSILAEGLCFEFGNDSTKAGLL